jgi:gliding motility-associated-like protein
VTNAEGYTSSVSANVVISAQPTASPPPVIGTITQPSCSVSTGKVLLNGLPSAGTWILSTPEGVTLTGTGISTTVSGLFPGVYNFILTNSAVCISIPSSNVVIDPQPAEAPKLIISNPAPVCPPATVNLSAAEITAGSSKGLTFTYWMNAGATIPFITPTTAGAGTYYISGTTSSGCSDIKPVTVTVNQIEKANAGPDKVLENLYVTTLEAQVPGINSKGRWSVISGTADFFDSNYARTSVSKLSVGVNKFLWTITIGDCPPSFDSVSIIVHDMIIPTLITPNQDGKNDYFIVGGKQPGKTELEIFDRRGCRVYINDNYDNRWSGEDYQGNPLPDDTYFFVIKTDNGRQLSGYIVLRR